MGCASGKSAPVSPLSETEPRTQPPQDFNKLYQLGVKLGLGAFAQVREARSVSGDNSQAEIAVKIIDLRKVDPPYDANSSLLRVAQKEVNIWRAVGAHPNCVHLAEAFFSADSTLCYMVMEKCSSGLLSALDSAPELTERGLGNVFAQMLLGIAHCHKSKVVHRDIKPDNFLVGGANGQVIKLGDFGLSCTLPHPNQGLGGIFGTAPFMCPEMLKSAGYNEKADIWSFAVVVYALLFGTFPYLPKQQSSKEMKNAIAQGTPPAFEPVHKQTSSNSYKRSEEAVSFAKLVLDRDPRRRPSAVAALSMPWMSAALKGEHMIGEDLPSLRPSLHAAKKVGAFEMRDCVKESPLDGILNTLHLEHHGAPLPRIPTLPRDLVKRSMEDKTKERSNSKSNIGWENASNASTADGSDVFTGSTFSGWSKGADNIISGSTNEGSVVYDRRSVRSC